MISFSIVITVTSIYECSNNLAFVGCVERNSWIQCHSVNFPGKFWSTKVRLPVCRFQTVSRRPFSLQVACHITVVNHWSALLNWWLIELPISLTWKYLCRSNRNELGNRNQMAELFRSTLTVFCLNVSKLFRREWPFWTTETKDEKLTSLVYGMQRNVNRK